MTDTDLPVVVGYEPTAAAERAVDWARAEAHRRGVPLEVVDPMDLLRRRLAHPRPSAGTLTDDLTSARHFALEALSEAAGRAQLLVIGMRTEGEAHTPFALGDVASALTAYTDCPVAVVRGDTRRAPGPRRSVLVALEGGAADGRALHHAARVAGQELAPLAVVAAWAAAEGEVLDGTFPHASVLAADLAWHAADTVAGVHPGVRVSTHVAQGDLAEVVKDAAATAGLIVVGSRTRSGQGSLLQGRVSHRLIHSAPCPVVVVRDRAVNVPAGTASLRPGEPAPVAASR